MIDTPHGNKKKETKQGGKKMSMKIAEIVTQKIIAELEKGIIPWHKPWTGQGKCINYKTRKAYSFLNEMLLGREGEYLSFKQCADLGGRVKKGEHGHLVTFWKFLAVSEEKNGEKKDKKVPLLRYYTVFHLDQCDGIPSKLGENEQSKVFDASETVEQTTTLYFAKYGINFETVASDKAYYRPSTDEISMPLKEQFSDENNYYSVLLHESIHSTGHSTRLNRTKDITHFGSEMYSKEELIAEIGAAILMNHFMLETKDTFINSVAYIQSWIEVLKNDVNMIISASSKTTKAVDMILGKIKEEAICQQ